VTLLPGVEAGLATLKQKGLTLAVLSNSTPKAMQRDVGHLFPLFDVVIGDAAKPDTKKLVDVMREKRWSASQVLYVGDACSDALLARRAGVKCCLLLGGMGVKRNLLEEKPEYLCNNFSEMVDVALRLDEQMQSSKL
jgi:phosphoglycolate phosphatase